MQNRSKGAGESRKSYPSQTQIASEKTRRADAVPPPGPELTDPGPPPDPTPPKQRRLPKSVGHSTIAALTPEKEEDVSSRKKGLTKDLGGPGDLSRYRFVKVLGEGGMGKVYLSLDRDLKRHVALKILSSQREELRHRFLEEAQVMGQLDHPNVLPVYDLGLLPDRKLYYTMPVVRGTTLHDILEGLRDEDPAVVKVYPLTRLMQVFLEIAQAIQYAHEKGVIHRDLKPANVMIGAHGEVQVLDWGLAKVVEQGEVQTDRPMALTRLGQVMGTPAYMSPEQAVGQEATAASDLYALGTILYEMLTLTLPFLYESTRDTLSAQIMEKPPPPRERAPDRQISPILERICLQALIKLPEERQKSVQQLHDEVRAWLEEEIDQGNVEQEAEAKVLEAEQGMTSFLALSEEIEGLKEKRRQSSASLAELDDLLDKALKQRMDLASDLEALLNEALGIFEDHLRAREILASYYDYRAITEHNPLAKRRYELLKEMTGKKPAVGTGTTK